MSENDAGIRRLLDRAPAPGEREAWAEHYAQPPAPQPGQPARAFVFRIGTEWLALAADELHEAAAPRVVRPVPHRRDGALAGLVNLGGELLPCARLERVLGIEAEAGEARTRRLLVARAPGGRLAFAADEVYGILEYDATLLRPAPSKPTCARALIDWKGRPVGLLDGAALWSRVEGGLG